MMKQWRYAVPSYQRAERCRDSTLTVLAKHGVDPDLIDVFVANEQERTTYESVIPSDMYGRLIVGAPGMRAIRNFIQQWYDEGDWIVNIDDDIYDLRMKISDKKTMELPSLENFVQSAFEMATMRGANLWGIYPVHNAMFMKDQITFDLRYVIGCFWGCVVRKSQDYAVTLDDKEDFERTIKHYLQDGVVCRFNNVAPITKYYTEPGGMQVERTEQRVTESAHELVRRYPMLCSLNTKKKSGHAEVRLRDRRPSR